MKTLLVLALVIFSFTANATIYYISSSGNDSNNGTSTNAPWRTLDKVNSKIFSPGDNILFNRGDLFYGTLTINQSGTSGNPITFGAYGVGNNPVITGFTSVTNWINLGGNIWESESAVSTLSTCNILLINGMNTPMGRYPNNGWLTYQSSTSSSLNSSSLNGATTNWSGAEAVIKKERWIIDRNVITTASGTTINYVPGAYSGHAGWGFFIQNDARTLDTQNEWYYNPSTKKIRIYSNLQPSGIQLSTLANVLYGVNKNYIRIDSMSFTGANTDAFYLGNVGNWTIQNCTFDFNYNGIKGYQYGGSSSNLLISNCLVNHSNNNAISLSPEFAGAIISNNVIKNSGLLLGMSGSGDGQAEALNVTGSNYLIQYNEVDSCGYVGIGFNGGGVQCKNNYVNYFCSIKDDGGGIYTGNPQNGVVISNNIINNGIGADDGTGFTNNGKASGIYMDDNASGMRVLNNSISNIIYAGIFIHNGNNIEVRENTTYNCAIGFLVDNDTQNSFTTSIISKKNIFCANTTGTQFSPQEQKCISFKTAHTSGSDIARFGNVDSNYYARPIQTNGSIWASVYGVADSYYNLSQWQSAYGFDINSAVSPKTITDLNDLRFVYNSTNFSRTISLDANYIDVTSKVYNGIITLAPYTSAVLVRNGNLIKNQPPTATAGSSQTITLPTNIVTLNGSGNDSDGTISSYQWTKVLGPSSYTISNASSATTSVKGLIAGIYVFKLTVTDDKGATAADSVTITVNPAANIPPTATAGSSQTITLPTNTVTLTGSGKDSDGTVASYQWTKVSGPASYTINNASSAATSVKGLIAGIYVFKLIVTDNQGAAGTDSLTITVNPAANIPPTATAGSNQTITLPTNTITLTGSGNDSDGTISSYQWTKVLGPSSYTINNASSATTSVKGLIAGIYVFKLTVTDDKGATAADSVTITVNPPVNIPPTAIAGSSQTITLPTNTVTLNGSGNDSDGTISSYQWTKVLGPSSYTISNASSATTSVKGLIAGIYVFKLTVTDDKGATAADSVTITVNPAANIPPTATAGSSQTITLPTNTVTLNGRGNDSDGTISSYQWTKVLGPSSYTISNASSATTSVKGLIAGIYVFKLTVTDDKGATAADSVTITVNPAANIPPTATAGSNQTITLPTNTVTLNGRGNDSDGTISSYQWTKVLGPSSYTISNASSATTSVKGLIAGIYVFKLTVTDDKGATAADSVTITVNPAANIPPTAIAGSSQTITLPTNTVTLNGSANDSDGTISSYQWTKVLGPNAATIKNATSASTAVSGLVQGVYLFELKVTDDKGANGKDTVQISVNAANNIPPTANAGLDKVITLPTNNVILSGSGKDFDGSIANYSWTKISGPSPFSIKNSSSATSEMFELVEGVYQFELKVTDDKGDAGMDTVVVTVKAAANIAPTAHAGSGQSITLPQSTVTLTGSGTDQDGSISAYSWSKISGPSAFNITNPASAVTTVSQLVDGTYQFELKVTDNKGAFAKDTIQITVNKANLVVTPPVGQNMAPIADAGRDTTAVAPVTSITFNGTGSDADGTIAGYSWTQVSGPSNSTLSASNTPSATLTNLTAGTYEFELKVTDNEGATGRDTVKVTIALDRTAQESNTALKVYPNPVRTVASVEFITQDENTNINIRVTNVMGTAVYQKQFVTSSKNVTEQIDMSNLTKGIYTISVYFDGMERQSIKVIKL